MLDGWEVHLYTIIPSLQFEEFGPKKVWQSGELSYFWKVSKWY